MDCRKTYNIALRYVLENKWHHEKFLRSEAFNKHKMKTLLQKLFVSEAGIGKHKTWHLLLRTPKVPRQQAVYSLVTSLLAQRTKLEKRLVLVQKYPDARLLKMPFKFNPKFKSKKGWVNDSFCVEKRSFQILPGNKSFSFYKNIDTRASNEIVRSGFIVRKEKRKKQCIFREIKIEKGVLPDDVFSRDLRICFSHGSFSLMQSVTTVIEERTQKVCIDKESVCSLDPGVRKFLTGYSPEGSGFVLGCNTSKVLDKCIRRIDKRKDNLESRIWKERQIKTKKAKHKVYIYRKKYRKAQEKAQNVVKDFHYKSSHFLCQSFDTILYPYFNSQSCMQGKLNRLVKRRMNMLSFFKFLERLKQTSTFYPGVTIKRGSEAYTSKQCGGCGIINECLGANEVFKCKDCGLEADRDMHAARNILLRHLT